MVVVGANSGIGGSARGPAIAGLTVVGVAPGAVFSGCVSGGCVEVGPSSGSVDVEVFVRYNAVCNAATGPTQSPCGMQFQTPRPGKKFSIRFPVSPHVSSLIGRKVQPLGSSIVLTPVVCTPSGRSGCDGKTATAPVGATEHVGVPLTVVERVPVHVMFGA